MSKEKDIAAYKALDHKVMNEKAADCMLEIVRAESPDKDEELFCYVKNKFTHNELAYIACIQIGLRVKKSLEDNPEIIGVIKMLRDADAAVKKHKENEDKSI